MEGGSAAMDYLQRLDLVISHVQTQLLDTAFNGVPTSQARSEVDVSAHAEIRGVNDFVGAGLVQNGLGVDAGLVSEGTEAGDGVVERDVDLDGLGDEIFNLLELVELVS